MDDRRIVELFLNRSEEALLQIDIKYGRYCHRVALTYSETLRTARSASMMPI